MPVEFNPKKKANGTEALPKRTDFPSVFSLSPESVINTFVLFNRNKEQSKSQLEMKMIADQPHLYEFLSSQICRKNVLNKGEREKRQEAYREGSLFTYAILSDHADKKGDGLPLVLPVDKKLYNQDFRLRYSDTLFEMPIKTLNERMEIIFQAEPALEKPIKAQKKNGSIEYYPFRRGVIDTHYAISNTVINQAFEKKFL